MKFERITLENFRQYYGQERLDFAKDNQRRVTVIHGVNGAGKTSLFLAINWCLYGEGVDNVGELISKEAIKQASPGDTITMSVELSFSHDGERFLLKRSRQGVRMLDGSAQVYSSDEFIMIRILWDGQAQSIKNPIGQINAILPSNIRSYYLFDGEKIDDFAKPEAAKEVKEAIYLVFKLETLDRARRHLETAANDYRKDLKNSTSGELFNLLNDDEKARGELGKKEKRKEEITVEIEAARRKITDIDRGLREIQNAKFLQQQRDRVEQDLKQRRAELADVQNQIRDISTTSYFIIMQSAIDRALSLLNEKRERGEIPSNIRRQFVEDLIAQMQCICGRPFASDGPEHQRLLRILDNALPGSLEDDVLDITATLRAFNERIIRQRNELTTLMKRRAELVDLIKDLDAESDDVRRQLKDSQFEEVSRLELQRENFLADIERYNIETVELSITIQGLKEKIAQLEKRITQARKNEKREKLLSIKFDLAQKAADAIKDTYQSYADDMRLRIEAKTKEIFKKLIWKDSHFQDVCISKDFELEVIDRYRRPARPELSAGERQILSLSFITAMSRISEEEAPLVMDTPFGRLSSQPRSNVTKFLPDLADQLVFLVTDEELRDQARENLASRIGYEYILEFDPKTSCTNIVEVRR
jgi:DNA sulfur modification protein DndD